MVVHGLTPELVPPYPAKPGFSKCLCLHNAYYIINQAICQTGAEIGKGEISSTPALLFYEDYIDCFDQSINFVALLETRIIEAFSRHHGRESQSIVLSCASHLDFRHDFISSYCLDFS